MTLTKLFLSSLAFRDEIYNLVKKEGIRGLGKGFTLNIIKGPISLSISLTVYDLLNDFLRKYQMKK